jgi:hypothetical protein
MIENITSPLTVTQPPFTLYTSDRDILSRFVILVRQGVIGMWDTCDASCSFYLFRASCKL